MRLVADASALVAESLRARGRALIAHQELELFIAEPAWSEVLHELRKRVLVMGSRGRLPIEATEATFTVAVELVTGRVARVPGTDYAPLERAARPRIPRDPNDWPTVATAMLLDAAIWTHDYDFFGCGLPTWTTETLLAHLDGSRDAG